MDNLLDIITDLNQTLKKFDAKWRLRHHEYSFSYDKTVIWSDTGPNQTAQLNMSDRPRLSFFVDIDKGGLMLEDNVLDSEENPTLCGNVTINQDDINLGKSSTNPIPPRKVAKKVSWADELELVHLFMPDDKVNDSVDNPSLDGTETIDMRVNDLDQILTNHTPPQQVVKKVVSWADELDVVHTGVEEGSAVIVDTDDTFFQNVQAETDVYKEFKCDRCVKMFSKKSNMLRHQKTCLGKVFLMLKCSNCSKIFRSPKSLRQHLRNKCAQNNGWKCRMCEEVFCDQESMFSHKRRQHLEVECDLCDKTVLKSNFSRHMKTHKNSTPAKLKLSKRRIETKKHLCTVCDKKFYDRSTLNRHIKCHEPGVQFASLENDIGYNAEEVTGQVHADTECLDYNDTVRDSIIETFNTLDSIFSVSVKKSLTISLLKEQFTRNTRRELDLNIVRILVAIAPQLYDICKLIYEIQATLFSYKKLFYKKPSLNIGKNLRKS